jgi:hypothetical protein
MKRTGHVRNYVSLIVLLSSALVGCGWERKVAFPSGASFNVQIQQPFPANGWGLRVLLQSKGYSKTLYELRGDVFLDFADVAWSAGNGAVVVLTCGTPPIRLAYNLTNNTFIPFASMESTVVAHIYAQYLGERKMSDRDVLEWACSSDGRDAFYQRYPGVSPR